MLMYIMAVAVVTISLVDISFYLFLYILLVYDMGYSSGITAATSHVAPFSV